MVVESGSIANGRFRRALIAAEGRANERKGLGCRGLPTTYSIDTNADNFHRPPKAQVLDMSTDAGAGNRNFGITPHIKSEW